MHTIQLLLAVAAIILAVIWYRTRDRRVLLGLGGVAGVLAALFLITGLVRLFGGESDSNQMKRKVEDMARGVGARNLDQIFQHVSDSFQKGDTTKAMLREYARQKIDNSEVTNVEVWKFQEAVISPARDGQPATATIHFLVKVTVEGGDQLPPWECDAIFVKDPDAQWRLKRFEIFPLQRTEPVTIPGLN